MAPQEREIDEGGVDEPNAPAVAEEAENYGLGDAPEGEDETENLDTE